MTETKSFNPEQEHPARRYTVLLIEDDPHTVELLSYNLAEAGFDVLCSSDGVEALRMVRQHHVDAIICDVMIPMLDGFAFREEMARDPVLRDIAFVFLTAKTMAEDQIRGLRSGADEYITKPFDPSVLVTRVQIVLDRREKFARVSRIDPLTQLLNRQTLDTEVARELERIRRYPSVGSLVFLDIDNFKWVNDSFGHAEGDRVLRELAATLKQNSRSVDIVGRYGGEEFMAYFPETPETEALYVVRRMQQRFVTTVGPEARQMTFSAGVAEAPRDANELAALCARADSAMYAAKRQGKARALAWRPGIEDEG